MGAQFSAQGAAIQRGSLACLRSCACWGLAPRPAYFQTHCATEEWSFTNPECRCFRDREHKGRHPELCFFLCQVWAVAAAPMLSADCFVHSKGVGSVCCAEVVNTHIEKVFRANCTVCLFLQLIFFFYSFQTFCKVAKWSSSVKALGAGR